MQREPWGASKWMTMRKLIQLTTAGLLVGTVGTGFAIVAAPAFEPASASTANAATSTGFYRGSDASWHMSFDVPPTGESNIAFRYGPTNSGSEIVPVTGDWNGDGTTSVGWYRYSDASWHLSNQLNGVASSDTTFVFGVPGDTSVEPVVGDWNGDGKDTVGWYRPSDASWHLRNTNSSGDSTITFVWGLAGNTTTQAVAGDWNGDGKDTIGFYRPSDGSWHLGSALAASLTTTTFVFGPAGDKSVKTFVGDWNGNGTDAVGWYRPSDASFHLTNSTTTTSSSDYTFTAGPRGDSTVTPISGDWDGKATSPSSPSLPSSPSAAQAVAYARSYLGKTLPQIRPTTTSPWSAYPNADWCAWFATWVLRQNTGGKYYTYVSDMNKLGTRVSAPAVGDLVIFGNYHVGIVSKNVNGVWYLIDGNGGNNSPTVSKVAERPIWSDAHTFVRIAY